MAREILFRGKRIDNGEWVEGGIIPLDIDSGYVFIAERFLSASTLPVHEIVKHHMHLVIPKTVGQYTGLTDKDGKKIFEGDIVKTSKFGKEDGSGKNYAGFERFCVEFSEGGYHLMNEWRRFNLRPDVDMEVVGNIHDISEEE